MIDIVLQELLLGSRQIEEVSLGTLIDHYDYPDPESQAIRGLYYREATDW